MKILIFLLTLFVQIRIIDSGTGLSEKVKSHLYMPFFSTKEVGKGTGLGLSISKGIMTAHHGDLFLDEFSRSLGFPRSKTAKVIVK